MSWPTVVRKIGNTNGDPDSLLLGGPDGPLNHGVSDLEERTDILHKTLTRTMWMARVAGSSYAGNFNAVSSAGGVAPFVAVGASGEIQTSRDGIKWIRRTAASSYTGTFNGVCYSPELNLWVAVGAQTTAGQPPMIQTSPDGTNWTARTAVIAGSNVLLAVCWSAQVGLFVAVGLNGVIQTSPNGTTWTLRTAGSSYTGTFNSVSTGNVGGAFVAVGAAGEAQTSTDGINWTRRRNGGSALNHVTVDVFGYAAALGVGGLLLWSEDVGTSWTTIGGISDGPTDWLTSCFSTTHAAMFFVGTDGEVWTIYPPLEESPQRQALIGANVRAVADGLGIIVAVGASGKIWTTVGL